MSLRSQQVLSTCIFSPLFPQGTLVIGHQYLTCHMSPVTRPGTGLGISWIIRFFWYSNNSVNYSSGRIEYRIPSRQSFLCRIVTDKCQIVTDEPNGNFFHFQYETVYCQAVAHCTALVSSLESRSSVKVDWGVQVPRLLLCRSNFCHYLIYLL